MQQEFIEEEKQGEPIGEIIRRDYLPFWPLVVLAALIGLGISHLVLRYKQPLYSASAKIMFRNVSQDKTQQVLSELTGIGSQSQDKTQQNLELMVSHQVLTRAAELVNLHAEIYSIGRVSGQNQYNAFPSFQYRFVNIESISSFQGEFSTNTKGAILLNGNPVLWDKEIEVAGNRVILTMNAEDQAKLKKGRHGLIIRNTDQVRGLLSQVVITPVKTKPSIDFSLVSDNAIKSENILTAIIKAYQQYSIEDSRDQSVSTLSFIDDRMQRIEQDLDSVEAGIEQFRKANPMASLSGTGINLLGDVKEADQKLAELQLQLQLLDELTIYLKGLGKRPGIMPSFSGLSFGAEIQTLLTALVEKEMALEELKLTTTTQSEGYQNAEALLQQLRANILELTGNVRKNLLTFQAKAKAEAEKYDQLIAQLPGQERQLFDINRQQLIKNELYTLLLTKREEAAIQSAVAVSDLVVLQPPSGSNTPVNINKPQTYAIGFIGGAVLVLLVLFLMQILNNKLVSRGQLESLTPIPVLGVIAQSKDEAHLVMTHNSRSGIAEQFRALRTNIGYYKPESKESLVVVLTSSIPGEGKSFNAANLALTFALTGAKTLLIESDLRKPNISKHFQLNRQKGLSTYLVGREDWTSLVEGTEFENLDILTSGPIPPNPVELIMNGRYKAMVEAAKLQYQYIVIDCPPVGVVTDAEVVASFADLMLFVTRYNKTPKEFIEKLINRYYSDKKITQTGILFNGLRPKGLGYYGYKYGYGYGYGYGYYSNDSKKKS